MSLPPREQPGEPPSDMENRADQQAIRGKEDSSSGFKKVIPPTISAFFSDSTISPPAFFKAIKSHKIKRFSRDDEAQVLELMARNDPNGGRLWALISQSPLPDAVDTWIWRATQDRLRTVIGANFDPVEPDAGRILNSLRDTLAPGLKAKDRHERTRAENWLRIGVCWLVAKRSLQPWTVAESLLTALFQEHTRAFHASLRVFQRGRLNEFKLAVAMAGVAQEMVKAARAERDSERQSAAGFRNQLADARSLIDDLKSQLTSTETQLTEKSRTLGAVQVQLESERQHWGHDLSETKAEQRMLLSERLAPLVSDAIDALEIEPPAPQIALRRLKTVLSLIQGAKS